MTYGELFDLMREDVEEFIDEHVSVEGINLDDEVEDEGDVIGELQSFISHRSQERNS